MPLFEAPSRQVTAEYWSGAEAAGTARLHRGLRFVAGTFTDPLTEDRGVLVEYAEPPALAAPEALNSLVLDVAADGGVPRGQAQLRAPATAVLPPPWRPTLTYVRLVRALPEVPLDHGTAIVPAGPEHRAAVTEWLERAVRQGAHDAGLEPGGEAVREAAAETLADPGLRSLVAVRDGIALGHAVVRTGAVDAVTGEDFVELWDVLVEPSVPGAGTVRNALTGAAAELARNAGLPLIGHVVHGRGEHGTRVLATLRDHGWQSDHVYWKAELAELGAAS
ncbi:GNAT family N-acetyltransferase [Streptomyces sp. NPDC059629]|uniref:GNAT family N-acetyltransferase n=1 Tax=Streptomyces sp. NPDC059629 TaxID=3346889 RepID=UPI0036C1B2DE